jgi:hypothetical protein
MGQGMVRKTDLRNGTSWGKNLIQNLCSVDIYYLHVRGVVFYYVDEKADLY